MTKPTRRASQACAGGPPDLSDCGVREMRHVLPDVDARRKAQGISSGIPASPPDSKFKDGMKGARSFVSGLLGSLGFKVDVGKRRAPVSLRHSRLSWPHVLIYGTRRASRRTR